MATDAPLIDRLEAHGQDRVDSEPVAALARLEEADVEPADCAHRLSPRLSHARSVAPKKVLTGMPRGLKASKAAFDSAPPAYIAALR